MDLEELFGKDRHHQQRHRYHQQFDRHDHDDHDDYDHHHDYKRHDAGRIFGFDRHDDRHENFGFDGQNFHNDHNSYQHNQLFGLKQKIFGNLLQNPKMRWILVLTALTAVFGLILIIALCFPLLERLFSYFSQHGIQGIIDTVWKGSGK